MFDLKKFLDDTARNLGNFANDVGRNVNAVTQPQRSAPQPGSTARPQVTQQRPQNGMQQRSQPFQRPVRQPQMPVFDPNSLFNDIRKNVEKTVKNVGDFTKPIIDGVVDTGVKAANTAAYVPQAVSQVIKENNGLSAPEVAQGRRDLEATLRRSFVPTDTAMGKTNPVDFAKQFTQAGVETANLIPTKGAVTGLANGLSKQAVAKSLMTNAGQAGVLGTANVGNDALQGREITPESLAMNYALPFALGAGSELAGGAVRSGLRTGLVGAQKTAPAVRAVNNRIEQLNPAVKELDTTIAQYQRAFDVEADPVRRAQINQGLADLNAQRRNISQGGYIKNPLGDTNEIPQASNVPNPASGVGNLSGAVPTETGRAVGGNPSYVNNNIDATVQPRIRTRLISDRSSGASIDQSISPIIPSQQQLQQRLQPQSEIPTTTGAEFGKTQNQLFSPDTNPISPALDPTDLRRTDVAGASNLPSTARLQELSQPQLQQPEQRTPLSLVDDNINSTSGKTIPNNPGTVKKLPEFNTNKVSNIDKIFRSTRSIIERQGNEGKQLAGLLQKSRDDEELFQAELLKQMPDVFKLKGKDFENFVEATQGISSPNNPKVIRAIEQWQSTHPQIRERAVAAGIDVGDLGATYYPHFIDYDRIFKDKNTYNEAINHLVNTGQAPSAEEAIKLLGYARDTSRNRTFGNLEASRLIDLPFYDKTNNSLRQYIQSSTRRISQVENFGAKDEEALKLIAEAGLKGADTESMKNAYDVAVGARKYNASTESASRNVRRYITTTRLGLGALTNTSQNVNTGIVTGHLRTMKSMIKQLNPETRRFVEDTGTIADAIINDIRSQQGFESFGKTLAGKTVNAVTAPLFGTVEKFNRSVAATAGRDYALRLAQKGDENTLRKLGVTGEIKDKTLTKQQQIQAARKIVEKTQFKVDPQDLPGWADSPGGKLVSQFRTFSYNQGKFISNEVLKPAAKGNVAPLVRLLAALPLGYALYETRRTIDGRPEEEDQFKKGLEAFSKVGGAGLAFDIYRGINPVNGNYLPPDRRVSMAASTIGGPAIGQAIGAIGGLSEAIQNKKIPSSNPELEGKVAIRSGSGDEEKYNDLTALTRQGIQQIPIVGTPIANRVIPYKKQTEADQGKTTAGKTNLENDKLEQVVNAKNERTKAFKESLSKDDYAIAQMSKKEQEKLVSDGVITEEKLSGLRGYVENKRKELGYDDSKKSKKEDLTSSNDAEYKELKAAYDEKIKNNEYTTAQRIKAESQLNKAKIGSEYSKETRDLYGLSKAQLYAYVSSNENGKKILEDVLAYGDKLKEAGINSYNKFRDKNGNVAVAPAKKGSGGRKKSGGGKGGKKKGSSYDYAGSLKSLNSLGNNNQKALRSLVRGTGKYTRKKINGGKTA